MSKKSIKTINFYRMSVLEDAVEQATEGAILLTPHGISTGLLHMDFIADGINGATPTEAIKYAADITFIARIAKSVNAMRLHIDSSPWDAYSGHAARRSMDVEKIANAIGSHDRQSIMDFIAESTRILTN